MSSRRLLPLSTFALFATLLSPADALHAQAPDVQSSIDLPSSKQLLPGAPGSPVRINSLPMSMALSPDRKFAVTVNAGFGTFESNYQQSISVIDTASGKVTDFPDARTGLTAHQTLYQGIAFGRDGRHIYASIASLTAPEGKWKQAEGSSAPAKPEVVTGNAIVVYTFSNGTLAPERLLPVPLQTLAPGKQQGQLKGPLPAAKANPYPSGICVVSGPNGSDRILVADNLSDDVLLLDATSGNTITRFDLSTEKVVPATYPIAVTATRDGKRAFVALWNSSAVVALDLVHGTVGASTPLLKPSSPTAPGSHPAALELSPDQKTLYVALANRDMVAAIDTSSLKPIGYFDTKLPGQSYFGAVPDALAISPEGTRLYVANASSDAVAVFDTAFPKRNYVARSKPQMAAPLGFLPTEWYPTALGVVGDRLLIATAKGKGTGPNNRPQPLVPGAPKSRRDGKTTYIATLLYGSVATLDRNEAERNLPQLTAEVTKSNRLNAAEEDILFGTGHNPIRHVIYIIRENRTFDQILGDEPASNADPSLVMYGRVATPNFHKLVEQFGILDNFYDSGEVSGDGHVWSNAAISSDYTERTWQQSYRGAERLYDFEGVVAEGFPLLQHIPDVNEPASGYLWTNLAKNNKTYFHFAEFISTKFCGKPESGQTSSPTEGTPEPGPEPCAKNTIAPGSPIPANYGGGTSKYPWAIPLIARNIATKPELEGHFDPLYPDFNLLFPDDLRFNEFNLKLEQWKADRAAGHDTMPQFIQLRFPNDHTAGTRPGSPRPIASIADNDIAVGRTVEAISHSAFWDDTAIFVLEDDAQNGADHVDAHRSVMLVASKYAPRPEVGTTSRTVTHKGTTTEPGTTTTTEATTSTATTNITPFVDHTFYTTVSAIRTMERLLDLPPMNNNDAFAPLMSPEFSGPGDQPAFTADLSNRDNGTVYLMNTPSSPGAKASARMDFDHADRADAAKLNVILWRDSKGNTPLPPALKHPAPPKKDNDD